MSTESNAACANGSASATAHATHAQPRRVLLFDDQRHARRGFVQNRHQAREQIRPDGVDRADAQRTGERVPRLLGDALHALQLVEHAPCLFDDAFADRRDRNLGLAALEQGHAQLVLELLHRHAQGRLADEAGLGGAPEMMFARQCHDIAEFGERHGVWILPDADACRVILYIRYVATGKTPRRDSVAEAEGHRPAARPSGRSYDR